MNDIRITLRLPESLHKIVTKTAETEDRSLNGQIVYLLKKALAIPSQPKNKTKK